MQTKLCMWGLVLMGVLVCGCKSMDTDKSASMMSHKSVVITDPHGEVAYYTLGQGGTLAVQAQPGFHQCADCEAAVMAYYKTGTIDLVCKSCGAKRMVIQDLPALAATGHQ